MVCVEGVGECCPVNLRTLYLCVVILVLVPYLGTASVQRDPVQLVESHLCFYARAPWFNDGMKVKAVGCMDLALTVRNTVVDFSGDGIPDRVRAIEYTDSQSGRTFTRFHFDRSTYTSTYHVGGADPWFKKEYVQVERVTTKGGSATTEGRMEMQEFEGRAAALFFDVDNDGDEDMVVVKVNVVDNTTVRGVTQVVGE